LHPDSSLYQILHGLNQNNYSLRFIVDTTLHDIFHRGGMWDAACAGMWLGQAKAARGRRPSSLFPPKFMNTSLLSTLKT